MVCISCQREWPGPCMGIRDGSGPALTFVLGWPQASHSPSWPFVIVPSINEDARLHGSQNPFHFWNSRILWGQCSFVVRLKTAPYPFRSTRGRYDPCFDPPPNRTITMVSALKEKRGKLGPSPLSSMEGTWKKTLLKLSLRPRINKGSSVYCFWSHISFLGQMLTSHS